MYEKISNESSIKNTIEIRLIDYQKNCMNQLTDLVAFIAEKT